MTATSTASHGPDHVALTCPHAMPSAEPQTPDGPPVFDVRANGVGAWAISRYDDVRAVLADTEGFSSRLDPGDVLPGPDSTPSLPVLPGMFAHRDGDAHLDYRRLLGHEFSARRTQRLAGRIGRMAQRRLDVMTAAGAPADLVADYALPLCAETVCYVLGVEWTPSTAEEILRLFAGQDLGIHEFYAPGTPIDDFALDLSRQVMKDPGQNSGLLGRIAGQPLSSGGRVGEAELAGVAKQVLLTAHVNPTQMLALSTLTLLHEQREWYTALGKDSQSAAPVVEELLRHITIKQSGLLRRATRDTELAGARIRAGEWVICALRAGTDNPHGHTLDFDPAGHTGGYLSFGHGPHECLGQSLSRVILQEALTALSRRIPHLRLAMPRHQIAFRDRDKVVGGVERLPVTW